VLLWDKFDYAGVEGELKLALSLNPSYSRAHSDYAILLQGLSRPEEALLEFALAEAADPLWYYPYAHHAELLVWLGRFDEAYSKIEKLRELGLEGTGYHWQLAAYHLARGNLEECLREGHLAVEEGEDERSKPVGGAYLLAIAGEKEKALALLRDDPTLADFGQNAHFMAEVYSELGDLDMCFRLMHTALERNNLPIFPYLLNPRYRAVRSDPRFRDILTKMNLG
jgi:tetratricopeptide (TPR) repeat protein